MTPRQRALLVYIFIVTAGFVLLTLRAEDTRLRVDQLQPRVSNLEKIRRVEKRTGRLERQVLPIQRVLVRKDILRDGPRGLRGGSGPRGLGAVGPEGPFGAPGADSIVPGPPGPDSTVPGPSGADSTVPGPKGDKGEDSTVPGPQGPGPTDEQIAAVVAAYFAGRTWTCEPTADVLDPPTTQTCTLDP